MEISSNLLWLLLILSAAVIGTAAVVAAVLLRRRFSQRMQAFEQVLANFEGSFEHLQTHFASQIGSLQKDSASQFEIHRAHFAGQLENLQAQIDELEKRSVERLQTEGQNRQEQVDKLKLQLQLLQTEKLVQLGEYQGSVSEELAEEVRRQLRDLDEKIGSLPF